MGWLLCAGMIVVALIYVAAERTPITEEHNTEEDVDHHYIIGNNDFRRLKGKELEPQREQMN